MPLCLRAHHRDTWQWPRAPTCQGQRSGLHGVSATAHDIGMLIPHSPWFFTGRRGSVCVHLRAWRWAFPSAARRPVARWLFSMYSYLSCLKVGHFNFRGQGSCAKAGRSLKHDLSRCCTDVAFKSGRIRPTLGPAVIVCQMTGDNNALSVLAYQPCRRFNPGDGPCWAAWRRQTFMVFLAQAASSEVVPWSSC